MKLKLISFIILLVSAQSFVFANRSAIAINNKTEDAVGSLSGTITDKADGKSIIGATINIPDLRKGAITDVNGKYAFTNIPKGIYLVQVSYIGYGTINQRVDFSKVTVFDVKMQTSSVETGEVVITGV